MTKKIGRAKVKSIFSIMYTAWKTNSPLVRNDLVAGMLGRKDMVTWRDKTNRPKQAMMHELLTGRTRLI